MAARSLLALVAVLTVAGNIALGWGWPVALGAGVAVLLVGELAGRLMERQASPAGPGGPAKGDYAPLSSRELEVAVLVANGFANKEVARRLMIREKTVERHVDNIHKKLGIHTRVQLTNWIRDRGLLESPAAGDLMQRSSQP